REDGQFKIIDLDSFNGTFVNGIPIKEQVLEHSDQVAVGDILLLFLLHDVEDEAKPSLFQQDEGDLITRSTIRLQREEALYLHPEKILAALPPTARFARDLNALLKISTTVSSIREREKLQQQLLGLIFEVIPAERGAILLVDKNLEEFVSVSGWSKITGPDDAVGVSRTIINQVLHEGVAL